MHNNVAITGESVRLEKYNKHTDRWIKVYISRVGGAGSNLLAEVLTDITERKRYERRQEFLLKLSDVLRPPIHSQEIKRAALQIISENFEVECVQYGEVRDETLIFTCTDKHGDFSIRNGSVPTNSFGSVVETLTKGETFAIQDIRNENSYSKIELASFVQVNIVSIVIIPLVKAGHWIAALALYHSSPRQWKSEEIAMLQDAAERIWGAVARAEEALRETEARYEALVLASSAMVYRMSADWSVMLSLKGKNFIANTEEPRINWLEMYFPLEEHMRVMGAIHSAIRKKSIFELEHRIIQMDGREGWVFSCAAPLMNNKGEVIEWFGAATDITERKSIEQALKETDRRKDEFLAILSHELRNPLFPLKNAIYLLQHMEDNNPNNRQSLIQMMERQVNHLVRLVDEVHSIFKRDFLLKLNCTRNLLASLMLLTPLLKQVNHC